MPKDVPKDQQAGFAAGMSSKGLSKHTVPKEAQGGSSSKPDLSLLYMSEGPRTNDRKYLLGFNSRVDPGQFKGAAGSTSERFTYSMVNPDDWEFMPAKGSTTGSKDQGRNPNPCSVSVRPQIKGLGECQVNDRTDPITHFKHEGIIFKDPWRPNKRTGYRSAACKQTWTWQQGNDCGSRRFSYKGRVQRNKMDCRGKMHYLSGGEEDMVPAAQNDYIKSDMLPSSKHVHRNDKRTLAWCQRNSPSPRVCEKALNNGSDQVWDCMVYKQQPKPAVGNTSTQCSLRDSESAVATPPRASRGMLASVQSEPSLGVYQPSLDDSASAPFRAEGPLDSVTSMTIPSTTTEFVPPMQSETMESQGPMTSMQKPVRRAVPASARGVTPSSATPRSARGRSVPQKALARSASLTPRSSAPYQHQGFPYNPRQRLSATLRGEGLFTGATSATSLTETRNESTPGARRRSASVTSSGKPAWR